MKKSVSGVVTLILVQILILSGLYSSVSAAFTASLSGPAPVRTGDTIKIVFKVNGTNIYGLSGVLSYNTSQLELKSADQIIASPWVVDFSGNNFVAYDNELNAPINKSKDLLSVTFKVKNITIGSKITVSFSDVRATEGYDGQNEHSLGTISYNANVAAPLSTNNFLASLTVGNTGISPAFSKNTVSYSAEVPFSVTKLDVKAAAEDTSAKVSISSPSLAPAATTDVTVTVTADNGSKKIYTIKVKRLQNPDYIAGDNCDLSSLAVNGFLLSPAFNPSRATYLVWLPFETDSLTVKGIAADNKALGVEVVGGTGLAAGSDNEVKVICTAENGDIKEYIIIAKRAAANEEVIEPTETPAATPTTEPTTELKSDPTETQQDSGNGNGFPIWITVVSVILAAAGGFAIGKWGQRLLEKAK